jgi:hypothetical protein
MEHVSVQSSTIRTVAYDVRRELLEIEFHSGGLYQYLGVPEELYRSFLMSPSKGRYFDKHIKSTYRTVRLR